MTNYTPYPSLDLNNTDFGIAGDIAKTIGKDSEIDFTTALSLFISFFSSLISDKFYMNYGEYQLTPALHITLSSNSVYSQENQCLLSIKEIMSITEFMLKDKYNCYQNLKVFQQNFNKSTDLIWQIRDKSVELNSDGETLWDAVTDKRMLIIKKSKNDKSENSAQIVTVLNDSFLESQISCFKQDKILSSTKPQINYLNLTSNKKSVAILKKINNDTSTINHLHFCIKRNSYVSIPKSMLLKDKQLIAQKLSDIYFKSTHKLLKQEVILDKSGIIAWENIYKKITSEDSENSNNTHPNSQYIVLKFAMVFCVLNGNIKINEHHISLAEKFYELNIDSLNYLLGNNEKSPPALNPNEEKLLCALKEKPIVKSDIHKLFGKNIKVKIIDEILDKLSSLNLIRQSKTLNTTSKRTINLISLNS